MKITLIHGQNHKGSSYNIGRLLADKLAGNAEITEFFLPRDLNCFCTGCYGCVKKDDAVCPHYAEKSPILKSLEEADILIFTTPTYCLRASAPMKAFIDLSFSYWMPHRPRACMFSKKAVVISTAAGQGAKKAVKDVSTALFYWGIPYIKSYGISVQAMSWADVNAEKKVKIENNITKLADRLKKAGTPKAGIKTRLVFNMMRMMQKAGFGSGDTDRQYWEKNGWLQKNRPWKNV